MQTAMKKAVQVGRTTMLAIGLAVTLALVLGVATVALAAVPGDPFKLGKVNIINNATTTLQGSGPGGVVAKPLLAVTRDGTTSGPTLRVDNTSSAVGARGIDINVPNGKMPINVNSSAGKADLNVDRLDGRDEQDFLSASRIYSKTALKTGPGNGGEVLFTALDGPEGLACDEGDVALDGGGNANDIDDDLNNITRSSPSAYQIEFQDNGDPDLFRATIVCSDSSKPFRAQ